MKLNDIQKKKLIKEAYACLSKIEFLLSSVDEKLMAKQNKAA